VGGLATGELESSQKVIGSVTSEGMLKKYQKQKIDFKAGEKVGYIVGAAGLMLGLGNERGMDGICLLGQTSGFPIVTDPKAAEAVLNVLVKMLGLDIDMGKLEKKVSEMEDFIKKIESLQKKAIMELSKGPKTPHGEELRYIG
jgi:proteasome assembly chaperone (PAC2) family protein